MLALAFFAVLDADDGNHDAARQVWEDLLAQEAGLICSNYVLVETLALVQHRLGIPAIRTFQEDIMPVLNVEWVEENSSFVGVKAQVGQAQFGQLAAAAQARDGQGRVGAAGDDQVHLRRQMVEQKGEGAMDGLRLDHVVVIEDEGKGIRAYSGDLVDQAR